MMAFSDMWYQISHLSSTLSTQEKGKLSSQPESNISGKVEGVNAISSTNKDIHQISAALSLQNGKVLNEPI